MPTRTDYLNPLYPFDDEGECQMYYPSKEDCETAITRTKNYLLREMENAKAKEVVWHLCPYCGSPHLTPGRLNNHLRHCKSKPKDVPHE